MVIPILSSFGRTFSIRFKRIDSLSTTSQTTNNDLQTAQMSLQRAGSTQAKSTRRTSNRLEHTDSSSSVQQHNQNNITPAQMPLQRAESSQSKSRPSPSEERLATHLPQRPHDTLAGYYAGHTRENIAEEEAIEDSGDISRVSFVELQKKYRQLEQRLKKMDGQCSDLVEEITGLRAKSFLDDDSTLRDSFKTLDFSIRSWCIRLREYKTSVNQPMSLTYPFVRDKASYLFRTSADELLFLKSGLWAWLMKLVFDGATDMQNGDPDLWVDENSSIAMRHFEQLFLKHDPRGTQEWRCLTVRMLAQSHAQPDLKRIRRLVKRIINWATEDVGQEISQVEDLTNRLGPEVVEKAVRLSLDIRRQYARYTIRFPAESQLLFTQQEEVAALPGSLADSTSSQNASEPGIIEIFAMPCLQKGEQLHAASIDQDLVVLVESESVNMPIDRIINRRASPIERHSSQDRFGKCVMM